MNDGSIAFYQRQTVKEISNESVTIESHFNSIYLLGDGSLNNSNEYQATQSRESSMEMDGLPL